jgi:hypothetical protein
MGDEMKFTDILGEKVDIVPERIDYIHANEAYISVFLKDGYGVIVDCTKPKDYWALRKIAPPDSDFY